MMRINRLDLTRYGKFTDKHIDFGRVEPGRPDLHIIYGPNEAGKSTALSAFLDLLFGIESRSRYDFLHPYATMRIGAALDIGGVARELVRIKKPQNSLLGPGDQPIGEHLILGELGGVERDVYCAMFSLDDDTLEEGGESILASRGDLGQLLFSASTGLAALSQTLVELRSQADGLFKLRARSSEIGDLKSRLSDLKERKEQIDTLATHYRQMVETKERSLAHYDEAMADRTRTQLRLDEIKNLLTALPRLAELRDIRDVLAELQDIPQAPPSWGNELPALRQEDIELAVKRETAKASMAELEKGLNAIGLDDIALTLGQRMDAISELHARYVTAARDLPDRRLQLMEVDREIANILRLLERPEDDEPSSLMLGSRISGSIRDLVERRSGIDAILQNAKREAAEANRRLIELRSKLSSEAAASTNSAAVAALARELSALRENDHAARRRVAERSRVDLKETLARQMSELLPWGESLDQVRQMRVPAPSELEAWKSALSKAEAEIDRYSDDSGRLTSELRCLRAELDALKNSTGVVDDHEAATSRSAREAAWATHRDALDESTAAAFEIELRKDDLITSARLGHMSDLAKLNQTYQRLAVAEAELERSAELLNAAKSKREAIRTDILDSARKMALTVSGEINLGGLEAWLGRREMVLATADLFREAEGDLRQAVADGTAARNRLSAALSAAAVSQDHSDSYEALLARAQSAVDLEVEHKNLREQLEHCEREQASRQSALETATADEAQWDASWAEVCKTCWLGAGGTIPSFATVKEVMDRLAELSPAAQRQAGLADRIAKMEEDQAAFSRELALMAAELGMERPAESALRFWALMSARVEEARSKKAERESKHLALEDQILKNRDLEGEIAVCERRKSEMTQLFGVSSLQEAEKKLRMIEQKRDLRRRSNIIEREIRDALSIQDMADAEQMLDAADRPPLEAEQVELRARFEDQDRRVRELFTAYSKASDEVDAVDGDCAVAALEEQRRTVLLEIEDKAFSYFRLRAGVVAAEQALRLYRDKHRSSMMLRASEAFQVISRGAYRGLATQPDKDTEVLIGIGADGSSKLAQEMSKGTRFQLYLALRVAGYHEFAQSRTPVPFIADDIMETFDDFRAEEAFRLFADMAKVGQVIYLTHHQHLCDIARRVCPNARIHELAPPLALESRAA
ncbi:AAA family ATPase [Mesorhizobium sp. M0808]|uniref:AAA family ATPase n=1 Tax=Mesorhizobium sp. M0808 TaxID=2957002 RepID=UPI0033386D12